MILESHFVLNIVYLEIYSMHFIRSTVFIDCIYYYIYLFIYEHSGGNALVWVIILSVYRFRLLRNQFYKTLYSPELG
jgi:hypothetical protein